VRKGKLREVNGGSKNCHTCGIKGACPFVVNLPRYYEPVKDDDPEPETTCACSTCTN
jgi:hypothetical protein